MKYLAIEFWDGRSTTTGTPKNGRCSLAVDIAVFKSRSEREEWISASLKREKMTRRDLPYYFAGDTPEEREQAIDAAFFERYGE